MNMERMKGLIRLTSTVVGVALAAVAILWVWHWLESSGVTEGESNEVAHETAADVIELSSNKLQVAGLSIDTAVSRTLARTVALMGRIDYDRTSFLQINAFDDLVIEQMPVQVGTRVKAGDVVLVAQCPGLGKARADVILQASQCKLTQAELDRLGQIHLGLDRLLKFVDQDMEVEQVQQQISQERLGAYRQQIIEAYSSASLARNLWEQGRVAAQQGALPGRQLQERQAAWQAAQSKLISTCDGAKFDVAQQLLEVQAELAQQQAQLAIDMEFLQHLSGETTIDEQQLAAVPKEELGLWRIKAPRDGVVVKLPVSLGARVAHERPLVELADPAQLWVRAWWRPAIGEVMAIEVGTEVRVARPESMDEPVVAEVLYTAAGFDEASAALPIIAQLDNSRGQFRAGQLVEVSVPMESAQPQLTVPSSSVCRHENQAFVFVPVGEGRFRRQPIELLWEEGPWTAVARGLEPGTEVVSGNAFYLKSELLLEAEE
jgi:cobalt-zinc-cadmium efflux system membrane fusion protein